MTRRPNCVEQVRDRLAGLSPTCDPALLDLYTLIALQYGEHTDAAMVHNAWAVWRNQTAPDHADLMPFPFLPPAVQAGDEPYAEAIRRAVREVYQDILAAHSGQAATEN